jgi:hypothetical protein
MQQGSFAPRALPRFIATANLAATVSPSVDFPVCAGYATALAPPISRWGEDGFSSCSACPCHRAVPNHPAGVSRRIGQFCVAPCCLRPEGGGSASGPIFLSRPPLGSLSLRPGDSLAILMMASSVGFIRFVSSANATQVTGLLTLAPVGLTPTEHASLCWTHSFAKIHTPRSD